MQNREIPEALEDARAESQYSRYSFAVDNGQADKVIGNAGDTLEVNRYIIRNVEIAFNAAQIAVAGGSTYNPAYGWESRDCAVMLSCIKRAYRGKELIFDCTTEEC